MDIAVYKVHENNGMRTFLWVMDNYSAEEIESIKLSQRGFSAGSHDGKWIGEGIMVTYDDKRRMQPITDDMRSTVRFLDVGQGKCDSKFCIESMPRPMACANTSCTNVDDPKKPEFKKCVRCMKTFYCSKECQISHWTPAHKAVCKRP